MKKTTLNYCIDMATGTAMLVCAVTGIVRLLPDTASISAAGQPVILGVDAVLWATIHDWAGVAMAIGVGAHTALHLRWLARMTRDLVLRRRPASGNTARPHPSLEGQSTPSTEVAAMAAVASASATAPASAPREEAVTPQTDSDASTPRLSRGAFLTGAAVIGATTLLVGLTAGCGGEPSGSGQESDSPSSGGSARSGEVAIDADACTGCGDCVRSCAHGVLALEGSTAVVQTSASCELCGHCLEACREGAITLGG